MIKNAMKLLSIMLSFILLTMTTDYTATNRNIDEVVDSLLESSCSDDHVKALQLMEENGYYVERIVITEYDILEQLNNEYRSGKCRKSYSLEEADAIVNYKENLTEKVISLQAESDETLKKYNYTQEQIEAIRNFDGSDEMLRASSSACTVYGGFTDYVHSASGTSARMIAAFNWNGVYSGGIFDAQDIFAVTWCSPLRESSAEGYVTYENSTYGNPQNRTATVVATGLYADSISFDKSVIAKYGSDYIGHTIKSGSIISQLSSNSDVVELVGYASYGVNTLFLNPSISVGAEEVGVGIGFSTGVEVAGSARFYN